LREEEESPETVHGFIGAWWKVYQGLSYPVIDAYALQDEVMFAEEKQFPQVIFETGCSEILRI
jgi:hypothetical protein